MDEKEILLNLVLHRYDEVNNRNISVDNKNKSMIGFIGVILTIEITILPQIFNRSSEILLINASRALICLEIISICCYAISIFYFISAITFVSTFQEAPVMSGIISSIENKEDADLIINKNIVSLQKCIEDNHEIVEDKTKKAKIGFEFFKYGLISTVTFFYFITIDFLEVIIWVKINPDKIINLRNNHPNHWALNRKQYLLQNPLTNLKCKQNA